MGTVFRNRPCSFKTIYTMISNKLNRYGMEQYQIIPSQMSMHLINIVLARNLWKTRRNSYGAERTPRSSRRLLHCMNTDNDVKFTVDLFLYGSPDLPFQTNMNIMYAVHKFVGSSKRFCRYRWLLTMFYSSTLPWNTVTIILRRVMCLLLSCL